MAKVRIKPIGSRVLVKQVEEDEQVIGGILIPESAKEQSQESVIVAVGDGVVDVSVGNRILTKKIVGVDVKNENATYKIYNAEDIIAIIG